MKDQLSVKKKSTAKLPYILLELVNNETPDNVDYIIADYILNHMNKLQGASIQDIADACEVSKSTLSRFCRKVGLEDFQELKFELQEIAEQSGRKFDIPLAHHEVEGYLKLVSEQVTALDQALDYKRIDKLVKEMYENKNIILLGSMQAMNPALNLQQNLMFSRKASRVPSMFALQVNAVERARPEDLIICFSNSGIFFERMFENQGDIKKLNHLRIWMITGNEKAKDYPYVDEVITIPDNLSYVSHPLQFELTARVIALAYAQYYKKMHQEK